MTKPLTDRAVQSLKPPPGKPRVEVADPAVQGLRLRIQRGQSGLTRTWIFRYRDRTTAKLVSTTLGHYPAVSLLDARRIALEHRQNLAEGASPQRIEREIRQGEPEVLSVAQLVSRFLRYLPGHRTSKGGPLAVKTRVGYEHYAGVIADAWKDRPATAISRADVVVLLDQQSDGHGHRAAGHVLAVGRALWGWAVERGTLPVNPWAGLKRQSRAYAGAKRDRVLLDDELQILLRTLPHSNMPPVPEMVLRLILWTGCRPGEACGMEWSEVDLDKGLWSLPAAKMKARVAHRVPLPRQAVEALTAFTSPKDRRGPVCMGRVAVYNPSVLSVRLKRRLENGAIPLPVFRAHDLRRSAATGLARLGAPREVIKRVLAHAEGDVTALYERHDFLAERRRWLQTWADHLDALTDPRVIPITRKKNIA